MKITNIETYPVWGGQRNFLFVVVDTDEGIYGVGEAGITGRELAVIGAIEHFKPLLVGQDPSRIEHIWQWLSRGAFFPAQRIQTAAISAIDIALWDIKGKALGVPIYDLLGGRVVQLAGRELDDERDLADPVLPARRAPGRPAKRAIPHSGESRVAAGDPAPETRPAVRSMQSPETVREGPARG